MRWARLGAALAATCLPVSLGAAFLAQSPSRAMDSAVGVVLVGAGLVIGRRDGARTGAPSSAGGPTGSGGQVTPPAPGTERPRVRGLTFRPPGEGR